MWLGDVRVVGWCVMARLAQPNPPFGLFKRAASSGGTHIDWCSFGCRAWSWSRGCWSARSAAGSAPIARNPRTGCAACAQAGACVHLVHTALLLAVGEREILANALAL